MTVLGKSRVARLQSIALQGGVLLWLLTLAPTTTLAQTAARFCHTFPNASLKYGDKGTEVGALQQALSQEGFAIDEQSGGAALFDFGTASAVSGFQEKYSEEVLAPSGLKYGTGFVGPGTRAKLNTLYGCSSGQAQAPRSKFIVKIIYPNGAEKWSAGSQVKIVYIASQVLPFQASFYRSGAFVTDAGTCRQSPCVFNLQQGMVSGRDYTVRLRYGTPSDSNYTFDESDAPFSIAGSQIAQGVAGTPQRAGVAPTPPAPTGTGFIPAPPGVTPTPTPSLVSPPAPVGGEPGGGSASTPPPPPEETPATPMTIVSAKLTSNTLTVDDLPVTATVNFRNNLSNTTLLNVALEASIQQGNTKRYGGGAFVSCGGARGSVLSGPCTGVIAVTAINQGASGGGTLVNGPANAVFQLKQGSVVLADFSLPVTLRIVTSQPPPPPPPNPTSTVILPPPVQPTPPPSLSFISAPSSSPVPTVTLLLSVTGPNITSVTWQNAANSASGAFTLAVPPLEYSASGIPLALGTNVITATAKDAAGNSATLQTSVFRKGIAPVVQIVVPITHNGGIYLTTSTAIDVLGSVTDADDPILSVTMIWSNALTHASGPLILTPFGGTAHVLLNVGLNTISYTATDPEGNVTTDTIGVNRSSVSSFVDQSSMASTLEALTQLLSALRAQVAQ